jgi:hypothetical protein
MSDTARIATARTTRGDCGRSPARVMKASRSPSRIRIRCRRQTAARARPAGCGWSPRGAGRRAMGARSSGRTGSPADGRMAWPSGMPDTRVGYPSHRRRRASQPRRREDRRSAHRPRQAPCCGTRPALPAEAGAPRSSPRKGHGNRDCRSPTRSAGGRRRRRPGAAGPRSEVHPQAQAVRPPARGAACVCSRQSIRRTPPPSGRRGGRSLRAARERHRRLSSPS